MKCTHVARIHQYLNRPLYRFLGGFPILRMLAKESRQSPVEYIADGFVANSDPGETYHDWLCRQVKEIIETGLMHDDISEGIRGECHASVHQKIINVELEEDDRQYIVEMFGSNPDLVLMYEDLTGKAAKAA